MPMEEEKIQMDYKDETGRWFVYYLLTLIFEGVQKIVSFAGARPNPEEEPARLTHFSEQSPYFRDVVVCNGTIRISL